MRRHVCHLHTPSAFSALKIFALLLYHAQRSLLANVDTYNALLGVTGWGKSCCSVMLSENGRLFHINNGKSNYRPEPVLLK